MAEQVAGIELPQQKAAVHIPQPGKKPGSPVQADGVHYYPSGPVVREFLNDDSFITGIRGPFGSGKSVAATMKLIKNFQTQRRGADGWIRRRTAIIRNTYPELRTTTMNTWFQWIPQHTGSWRDAGPPMMKITDPHKKTEWEIIFIALDRPDDVSKLLSMELSDAWINEAREIPYAVVMALTGRVGRYPPKFLSECDNAQIIMDTNPPDTEGWWYVLAERDQSNERNRQLVLSIEEAEIKLRIMGVLRPNQPIMRFHAQPSGRSPGAENIRNLRAGYYEFLMAGKTKDWIKVYVDGEYGFVMDGKPVYPDYKDSLHCRTFEAVSGIGIRIGLDFGLTPAASIDQRLPNGRWLVLDEITSDRLGIEPFAQELKRKLAADWSRYKVVAVHGDPAGDQGKGEIETCFMIMNAAKIPAVPAPTNDPIRRREAGGFLLRNNIDGEPGIIVHPRANYIRKGLAGGFHFRKLKLSGEDRYRDTPDKNMYSHPVEALEYDLVSAGEDRTVLYGGAADRSRTRQQYADNDYQILGD